MNLGLVSDHPLSFRSYMRDNFFKKVNVDPRKTHIPWSNVSDPYDECARYEKLIKEAGGIDLAILGIGLNGHIAFNEPGTPWEIGTHVAKLSKETRLAEAKKFGNIEAVPTHAITMGIKTIMQARKIVLLASGKEKAKILVKALEGPITPDVPASILQLHPNCTIIIDEAAASLL